MSSLVSQFDDVADIKLDAEREKLSGELDELEIAERVLARFGGKVVTTEKRQKARPVKTRRRLVKGAEREEANRRAACR